jgi:cell division protein FtsX
MYANYMLKYVWSDLWHKSNRPFTLINLVAISLATAVLVILLGSFLAFQRNGEQLMDRVGLSIEIHAGPNQTITDEVKPKLQSLQGVSSLQWWTPALFLFYSQQGRLCDNIRGRTVDLSDPLLATLRDMRGQQKIRLLSRQELGDRAYDELGIIVPFIMLKQLSYLPQSASYNNPASWRNQTFPEKIRIAVKENLPGATPIEVDLPVLGVVEDIEGGRYLLSKDCYRMFGYNWRNVFKPLLQDRQGRPMFANAGEATDEARKLLASMPAFPDSHGTVYAQKPEHLIPLLKQVRSLGLKAECALENHLEGYEQQKSFFMAVAGGISLTMFFFCGVILFATFKALVLSKWKEIGILKACGASRTLVYLLFALHVILLSGMATIMGMAIGAGGATQIGKLLQKQLELQNSQWFWMPLEYMTGLLTFFVGFCLIVAFFPVRAAARVDPDSVMRG